MYEVSSPYPPTTILLRVTEYHRVPRNLAVLCEVAETYQTECTCTHFFAHFRALEVWGSWTVLHFELERRRVELEEVERRRKGLSELITYLKKVNKDQGRKVQDKEASPNNFDMS